MHRKFLLFLILFSIFLNPTFVLARENVFDWYIKDFRTDIIVNKDSSLDITEWITADCGQASGKHGIFRILPERINISDGGIIKTPVELISITDFNGKSLEYSESKSYTDNTITWKIGDPDKTVQGENFYKIHYRVENAIRFANPDFDEFYWNLNGNFWDLEIDNFEANVIFPEEVNKNNSTVEYYTGYLGEKRKDLAVFDWSKDNVLNFNSTKTLLTRQGITASVIFPKKIFQPYQPGILETYGLYFSLFIPLAVFVLCFYLWFKYGKDPRVDKAIVPEYDAPGKLTSMEMGMLMSNGTFDKELVTAEIINLASKGLLTIKEHNQKVLLFNIKDYILTKKPNAEKESALLEPQKKILNKIFEEGNEVKLSELKNKFYEVLDDVEKETKKILEEKKLLTKKGSQLSITFVLIGILTVVATFLSPIFYPIFPGYFLACVFASGVIIFLFGLAMPKRTLLGANLNWEIKGFKMFMETVDKHRAEFYERENIFEKFLPYAIVFGITEIWIKKMKEIYGADFFTTHAPVWYIGSNMNAFDADSFSTAMDSLSSSIASNTSSPSGSGGSGGSGGGGGGGGGGGW